MIKNYLYNKYICTIFCILTIVPFVLSVVSQFYLLSLYSSLHPFSLLPWCNQSICAVTCLSFFPLVWKICVWIFPYSNFLIKVWNIQFPVIQTISWSQQTKWKRHCPGELWARCIETALWFMGLDLQIILSTPSWRLRMPNVSTATGLTIINLLVNDCYLDHLPFLSLMNSGI